LKLAKMLPFTEGTEQAKTLERELFG
jgi:hypothetical protein